MISKTIHQVAKVNRNFNKKLFVFDFDETITDANTDTWIYKALEGERLPQSVLDKFTTKGEWNQFMKEIFTHLHQSGVTEQQMIQTQSTIPIIPGMIDVLKRIKSSGHDNVIISNANTLFIEWILKHHKIDNLVDAVYTNPSYINEEGLLVLGVAHEHDCDICWHNQCKTKSMKSFVEEKIEKNDGYSNIHYFGDGINDICPVINLGKEDYGFVRRGFGLEDKVKELMENGTFD